MLIGLPASVRAKVLLLNAMLARGISNSELARRLNTRPQDVQRIVNLEHTTKIDTLEQALATCGLRLVIAVEAD